MDLSQVSTGAQAHIAVVIPTRNRPLLLAEALENLSLLELKPTIVVVVDSSDYTNSIEPQYRLNQAIFLNTKVRSASVQRNIGIDFLLSSKFWKEINLVSFLDDDVLVPELYFNTITEIFEANKEIVGFSGIALNTNEIKNKRLKRNIFSDWLGITGDPGSITKSAVNISPRGLLRRTEVDWLIGCSTWKKEIFDTLRFEEKFTGQSIFEDVIFSARARKFGKLVCDPDLILNHAMTHIGRDSTREHYIKWVKNREKIYDYDIEGISRLRFWILNISLLFYSTLRAPFKFREREKCIGLALGIWKIIELRRKN